MIFKALTEIQPYHTEEEKQDKRALALQLRILATKTKNERFLIKNESEGT